MEIEKPPLASPPWKALMLFDGDCHFCRTWIARWKYKTEDKVEYAPYQDNTVRFPEIPIENFKSSVQLLLPSGLIYSGARAVFEALAMVPEHRWPLWIYKYFPPFRFLSEFFYSLVARHRNFFSKLTKIVWGNELFDNRYFIARQIFLKMLAVIYFVAFWSLSVQILGLIGSEGINPAESFLDQIGDRFGAKRFWVLPSVFWFSISDLLLKLACYVGMGLSVFLLVGITPPLILLMLWILYLSLYSVGGIFLGYQWDILLLEVGFLAIFLSPLIFKPDRSREAPPSRAVLFLFKLLLFKLMLSSGLVKLLSNDQTWANLTALNFHYETQPIPTWTSWYAHQLPEWFQKLSVLKMFAIELILPFLLFLPRRIRYVAGLGFIGLQLIIIFTGNYCFFNWLTIALCLLIFDDSFWPRSWQESLNKKREWSKDFPAPNWPKLITCPVLFFLLLLTFVTWPGRLGIKINWPRPVIDVVRSVSRFHLVNNYGLFAVMTTKRPEIIVEGSTDGQTWEAYEFKYKPGDQKRKPVFVAPHQPRLDWQMWFASLGTVQQNPWFVNFCVRLMQGSKPVLSLLETNPFENEPPTYIRAMMYDYNFTDAATKKNQGLWWTKKNKREYLPVVSMKR